jgi:hypothetical protein
MVIVFYKKQLFPFYSISKYNNKITIRITKTPEGFGVAFRQDLKFKK